MSVITALRRTVVALGLAGVVAVYLRFNGDEELPAGDGGWRELSGPELD